MVAPAHDCSLTTLTDRNRAHRPALVRDVRRSKPATGRHAIHRYLGSPPRCHKRTHARELATSWTNTRPHCPRKAGPTGCSAIMTGRAHRRGVRPLLDFVPNHTSIAIPSARRCGGLRAEGRIYHGRAVAPARD